MISRARVLVAPVYLFACLVLGGSAQGIWQNMILQLAGVGILGWAALDEAEEPLAPAGRQLLLLAAIAIGVVALQMVPLPASVWAHLGPRNRIAADFQALGLGASAQPLSLTPALGFDALLDIIPPLALFCAMVRMKAYRPQWLAIAIIAGALLGVALGALQVASSSGQGALWYLYSDTNVGKAVGFFANADHMATLLVVTVPFVAAIVAAARRASMQRYSAVVAVAIGIGLVLVVGLALNGSIAGFGLALPVVAGSLLLILPATNRVRLWVIAVAGLLLVGAVAALETTAIGSSQIGAHATSATQSRAEIASTTARAAGDFMPFGSGLGSFRNVYPLYEHPQEVTDTYVVHAHNDYLEIALELGVAGVILIAVFLLWWVAAFWRAWRSPEGGPFARAAAIASAAILVHSLADFPLRTAALSVCLAVCLALLADSRSAPAKERKALRPTRHRAFK